MSVQPLMTVRHLYQRLTWASTSMAAPRHIATHPSMYLESFQLRSYRPAVIDWKEIDSPLRSHRRLTWHVVLGLVRSCTPKCIASSDAVFFIFVFFPPWLQLAPDVWLRHVMANFFWVWLTLNAFVILAFQICDLDGDFQGQVKIPCLQHGQADIYCLHVQYCEPHTKGLR